MSSSSSLLPTAARSILSSCRPPVYRGTMAPFTSSLNQQIRTKASVNAKVKAKKKDKGPRDFKQVDLSQMERFSLCDAMRYIRAFEVGREATATKYEAHIRLKTKRDGPVIRNMIRFPHAVQTESRICVICPPGTKHEREARAAGAVLVGEKEVFDAVKKGIIEFDRCLSHPESLDALNKAGLGRILGPRGLMPSVKAGTVVEDVANQVETLRGGTIYRERDAVIRAPIGQLAFSPEQLRDNLRVTIEQIKKDAAGLNDRVVKEIYEVVLSSTHGPGFSLNGEFKTGDSLDSSSLTGL